MPIELYSAQWQESVTRLATETFGEGFFGNPSRVANEPDSVIVLSQTEGDTLTGFVQGQVWPRGKLHDLLDARATEIPAELAQADEQGALGVIQAVAVAPEHRRRGIAATLLGVLHDKLVGLGADKLIVIFKRGPSAKTVDTMMGKLGFEAWTSIPAYWRERCDAGEVNCVDRGDACCCEALIYRKVVY
jgi:GNAT superfamily N-acetyltransferase